MTKDFSQRFMFEHQSIRGTIVRIEDAYQTILAQRTYPSAITHFLGQALLADLLLCSHLKIPGEITIQMKQEDSPIKMLVAKSNQQLQIRGLASWHQGFNDQTLADHLSSGKLIITLKSEDSNHRYQSIVEIKQQPIARVMEHFFLQSEQVPTSVWMMATDKQAVALLLQQMPNNKASENLAEIWHEVNVLTNTVTTDELLNLDTSTLLHRLYSEHDIRIFNPQHVSFHCPCSQSKMEGAILVMGKNEAMEILEEHPLIVVTCEYCKQEFGFNKEQVETIFSCH